MANLVMGAMGSLIPKLYQLLEKEYDLQTGVKERIKSLTQELELAQAALHKVAQVPWDQLDKQVQIWARHVREASYDMEDALDTFEVRVKSVDSAEQEESLLIKRLKKISKFFRNSKARRKISVEFKDIMTHLDEVMERCRRYKVDDIVAKPATTSTIDPRLHAMYTQVNKLVGIDKSSGELKSKLQLDDMSNMKMKTVSIVGIGGLGKTTLAKAVYNELKGDFDCRAFVPVGRNPDLLKVLQMILIALDKETYEKFNFALLQDITQFIDKFGEFLQQNKRYIIVIDDLWEERSWETLKLAIADDKSCEGRIIITTRQREVAKNADEVYQLPPLPYHSSRKLFYTRIDGDKRKFVDYQPDEISDEILRKCAGIPLAIITMASLLADEPTNRWLEVYKSIGFGCKENEVAENTMKKILSFSYYDLSSHLRTCLLYLSAFPEDSVIAKHLLVWMWAAEGFIQKQNGKGLFEIGESYFNDLINRSMIQEVEPDFNGNHIHGCCVHDMVLDLIRSISQEENFFTVYDNDDQGTLVQSNVVRRLANHNKTMVLSNQANMLHMSKVRSFIGMRWAIDSWAPISSFKLIRVLNIRYYYGNKFNHSPVRVEPLGHLLHLRFLGINGRPVEKIPEEIGALKMLQTLDLKSSIMELPSSSSLPTQLVCLHIVLDYSVHDAEMFSVGRLTSLEELSVQFCNMSKAPRRLVKELGCLRELRVFDAGFFFNSLDMERDLVESVRHLHKLQHLEISTGSSRFWDREPEGEFVLQGNLRYFVLQGSVLKKLPSCINPWCHYKLSHLELKLRIMDERELKTLGRLPELRFLELDLQYASPSICDISDSDACYFPKLRCLRLWSSMVLFVANKGDDGKKTVSFHLWDGGEDEDDSITMPSVSVSVSVSDGVHNSRRSFQPSKLQHGIALAPVSEEEKKDGSISTGEGDCEGTATPRFMPNLEVLHFVVRNQAVLDPCYCGNLGLELLCSLREIHVDIHKPWYKYGFNKCRQMVEPVKTALRSAAQIHPNHPTLHMV